MLNYWINAINDHCMYKFLEMVYAIVNHTCPSYLNNFIKLKNTSFSFRCENYGSIPKYETISHMANETSITMAPKGGGVPCYELYGFSVGLLYAVSKSFVVL